MKLIVEFALLTLAASCCLADGVESFTEPYRTANLAAPESGIVDAIDVKEGDVVQAGQVVAMLNQDVLNVTLKIARAAKDSVGQLKSAETELRIRSERLRKLADLLTSRNASQEEVDRATADRDVAQSQLLTVQESLEIKRLEYERTLAQIERRQIRSPFKGVVERVHKEVGEFVAPNDPNVLTVVQLDPLRITFPVPSSLRDALRRGASVDINLLESKVTATGTIDFVSPVTHAESSTVRVQVKLPNPNGRYRSGERCELQLPPKRVAVK